MRISRTLMIHMMKLGQHLTQSDNLANMASLETSYVLNMPNNDDPTLGDDDSEEEEEDEDEDDNDGYDENPND